MRALAKKHKHRIGLIVGLAIMLTGSTLATTHLDVLSFIPIALIDGFAYFLHGVGAIPFVHAIEPLWMFLIGE